MADVAKEAAALEASFLGAVRPILKQFCLDCHSAKELKGDLDLERFATIADVRRDPKPWQAMIEQVEAGEMPPKAKPQPTAEQKALLVAWARGFLDAEARAQAGDPGHVPLRRLSNAEYNYTIRDLTGVDLQPTREFPADGAAGEGFTNAAEALSDISPALFTKYLNAAKEIAEHAVLLPDGFRFSPTKTRRDWTDESTERLRAFYQPYGREGRLDVRPYVIATVKHRNALLGGKTTIDDVARLEQLNAKYLAALWQAWTDKTPSFPLDALRARWRTAAESEAGALADEVAAWQKSLWRFVAIGSYRFGEGPRQRPNDPTALPSPSLRLAMKPEPGQKEVVVYLASRDLLPPTTGETPLPQQVVWRRPRFEAQGKPPLLLRDYAQFGPAYEVDWSGPLGLTAKYLSAAQVAARDKKASDEVERQQGLDAELLARWVKLLDLAPLEKQLAGGLGREVPLVPLRLLEDKTPANDKAPAIWGWRRKGNDLPVVVSNSGDQAAQVPGRVSPHKLSAHPMPKEFVAVVWTSPVAATVRVTSHVAHAHPACGNGVAWWIEHRRGDKAFVIAEGAVALGKEEDGEVKSLAVEKGDSILLAIDPKASEHTCDMTELDLSIVATPGGTTWNLATDVADDIQAGNPHDDKHGNKAVWSFVEGPSPASRQTAQERAIPPASLLGKWRVAALDPARAEEAAKLAGEVQSLLTGPRPEQPNDPNRALFDQLVSSEGLLFQGLAVQRFARPRPDARPFALPPERFGGEVGGARISGEDLLAAAGAVVEIRLPAALFEQREFVIEASAAPDDAERAIHFQVMNVPPSNDLRWDGKSPLAARPDGPAMQKLRAGMDEFRRVFPTFLCFPNVVPTDEVVSLKMFHREDDPLRRLFLTEAEAATLDRLWAEHRFISQQPIAENAYLPQFIGFVTQDQPKELLAYFESQRPVFQQRADDFARDFEAAIPAHLDQLLQFASHAYRRPLLEQERNELVALYRTLRAKEAGHEEALHGVLARILVSPAFLFRIEKSPPGKLPGAVDDWELATRLSYFLWSSQPDDELRQLATAGELHEPEVLQDQLRRMLQDSRVRALAIEFGTQWIHVRGFDELKEKNERLFPTFDATLRAAIYEESILFFQDFFQQDRALSQLLDADYTYLNETLARHYAIPSVTGPEWRRVEGVKKYGRGGILALASVQTKQSGASRTSPTLRGNWVVEVLLGEKLPKPPPNVPAISEVEGADKLTTRQIVEMHARVAECAVCHVRVDPIGFALERYDTIGRLRDKDLGGNPVDTRAKLKDGTEFDGLDGLRSYLLSKKRETIERLFCQRLLGYALGRSVTLSDTKLLDEMVAALAENEGHIASVLDVIVQSSQFRMRRGADMAAK